ncbi:MAG: DUF6273 domain-containing protein [Erysipelotrichaceae bacterium]|jgi:hypothetical protein|nr:DUF6273 domain-containing protein [Erysipelotrichaceae bacterium]
MKKNIMTIMASGLAFLSCLAVITVVFLERDFDQNSKTTEVSGLGIDEEGLLLMGSFPQTVVSEDCTWLIPRLDAIQTTNTRGYIEYDGEEYARVVAHPDPYSPAGYFDSGAPIVEGDTYYFKVEPIKWRVLDEDRGMVLSDKILEAKEFSEYMKYSTDWQYSSLRFYLNDQWLSNSFTQDEKDLILYSEHLGDSSFSGAYVNSTLDYVYLPSGVEYMDPHLGFENDLGFDDARRSVATDYARATGCFFFMSNCGIYHSRSAATGGQMVCWSGEDGQINYAAANNPSIGVRPALNLDPYAFGNVNIIGEYTRGEVVVDVTGSLDLNNPRGSVSFYFEILDETWTTITYDMLDESYQYGYRFIISNNPLSLDVYLYNLGEFISAVELDMPTDMFSISLVENDLYLTFSDLGMRGRESNLIYTAIEATNVKNRIQIIDDYIYLSCNADWQKMIINYLHGEVSVDENDCFTFFFEINEALLTQHWTRISFEMIPIDGSSPYILHSITNSNGSVGWVESYENGMPSLDHSSRVHLSGSTITLMMDANNEKYPLNNRWDLIISVDGNTGFPQLIRNELILRSYAPIITDYTSGVVEISTTSIYNYYGFTFGDLTWTTIEMIAVSRGTNEAFIITVENDPAADRVFYRIESRLLGTDEPDQHIASMIAGTSGNQLTLKFETSPVNTGPIFDLTITAKNANYMTQVIETSLQYVYNQASASLFYDYASGDMNLVPSALGMRLDIFFEISRYGNISGLLYTMTSVDDPALRYALIFETGIMVFNTYYNNILIESLDLSTDSDNNMFYSPVSTEISYLSFLVLVDAALFQEKTFNVTAVVKSYFGGAQYKYSTVTWH